MRMREIIFILSFNKHFQFLEVVDRGSETQFQVKI